MPTTGSTDWVTTIGMITATGAAALACGAALKRLLRPRGWERRIEQAAVLVVTGVCGAVFVYRALAVHLSWEPLQSHVDGLSLLAAIIGAVVLYIQVTNRLRGIDLFALPVLAVLTLWGVCASWWTYQPFTITGLWMGVHLLSVYVGTAAVATAAAAGALYLFVDRQLRSRDHRAARLKLLGRFSDLETIEATITGAAKVGFLLVTVGLATGVVILTASPERMGPGWWYSPKVVLAAVVWVIFAMIMHVGFVPNFRGRRAAVLSIVGFVLMMGVLGLSLALPATTGTSDEDDGTDYTPTVLTSAEGG